MAEIYPIADCCRICLKTEIDELQPIFEADRHSQLSYCFPLVQILQDDGLPQKICQTCTEDLQICVSFKAKLEGSDNELRSIVGKVVKQQAAECDVDVKLELEIEPHEGDYDDKDFGGDEPMVEEEEEGEDEEEDAPKDASVECKNCKKRLDTQELLDEHQKKHQCVTNLMCNICKTKFKTRKSLRRHYKSSTHTARLTGSGVKIASDEEDSKAEIPTPDDLVCPICQKACSTRVGFRRHAKIHAEKKFSCATCNREFSRADQLAGHMKVHDNDAPKFECDICSKSYHLKSILREHIRIHTKESLALCSFCGKSFTSKSNLKQHILRHTNTKLFDCKDCGKKFVSKGELKGHIRIHTGEHPYVCDVCGIKFTMSYSLKKHKRTHTGERPYPCEFCPKSFKILETLKIHRRIHTGEKPYACSFCGRTFTQKNDMIKHERIHTGERLYGCNLCGKRFVQASTLNTHIKGVHKGQSAPQPSDTSEALIPNVVGQQLQTMVVTSEYHTTVVMNE